MTCPSDQLLAAQVRQGDERAFVTLVRRYERVLARLIGQYIGTGDDGVQDVLQETMASAWSALRKDTPRDVRAWIMQVARNRCRDYFRSTQRRELFVEDQTLELMVNRRGLAQARQRATASEVVEAMEEVTPQERAALRAFYVDGLSIAEIATRHQRPSGTIRHRLSHGRDQVRALLGVTRNERNRTMRQEKPFPEFRPAIRIEPSGEKPFRVDFTELVWWSSVPVVGDRVRLAHYEPLVANDGPWRLSCTVSSVARHPAVIHKRRCVEIECTDRYFDHAGFIYMTPASKKGRTSRFWGCLTEDGVEFVAVESVSPDGTRELWTFLDEGFDDDWGQANPRSLEDCGYLRQLADGSFFERAEQTADSGCGNIRGAYRRAFLCLLAGFRRESGRNGSRQPDRGLCHQGRPDADASSLQRQPLGQAGRAAAELGHGTHMDGGLAPRPPHRHRWRHLRALV